MVLAASGGGVGATPAGWVAGPATAGGAGPTGIGMFCKQAAAGDPASWTVGPTGIVGVSGVILDYTGHGFMLGGLAAVSTVAPSAFQWGSLSLMVEAWASDIAVPIVITGNINSPTTRATINSSDGSLLVVDFAATLFGTGWTGDTAGLGVVSASQALG